MKVKVGDTIYDSSEQPVMVILSAEERRDITLMAPGATKYCAFPDHNFTVQDMKTWMEE